MKTRGFLDDHYESLATLARYLAEYGHNLQQGQQAIIGAYGKIPFASGSYTGYFDQEVGPDTVHLTG